jgi:Glycosyltransferase
VNLVLAGDGPYAEALRAKLGNYGRVVFTGRLEQEELAALYSGADVFVFPSATDTFGLVVLEALACGLPAVVSDAGGPQEIVEDGISGFIARAGDPDDWEEKIGRIVCMIAASPPAYRAFRERARKKALESGGWDRVVEDIFGGHAGRETLREEITLKT